MAREKKNSEDEATFRILETTILTHLLWSLHLCGPHLHDTHSNLVIFSDTPVPTPFFLESRVCLAFLVDTGFMGVTRTNLLWICVTEGDLGGRLSVSQNATGATTRTLFFPQSHEGMDEGADGMGV